MEQGLITGPKAGIVVMSRERSVDIDEPIDFVIAEVIASREGARPSGEEPGFAGSGREGATTPGVGGCDELMKVKV
jgi:hypothetical protein